MATARLALSSSSSSSFLCKNTTTTLLSSSVSFPYPTLFCSLTSSSSSSSSSAIRSHAHNAFSSSSHYPALIKTKVVSVSAVAEEEPISSTSLVQEKEEEEENDGDSSSSGAESKVRPCELYVCNLPRSCNNSELLDMFKPHGSVLSAEISVNPETGMSRGSGYVTMGSFDEAKAAVSALDATDVGGREMRVRFSVDMNLKTLVPKRNMIFESPHKIYVGNLAWSVKPEHLREFFGQFGTVISAKVLYDRKGGRNRVYGFLSFSSAEELQAAISSDGKEFRGRNLLVRKALRSSEPIP